jgi:hypothetical protein
MGGDCSPLLGDHSSPEELLCTTLWFLHSGALAWDLCLLHEWQYLELARVTLGSPKEQWAGQAPHTFPSATQMKQSLVTCHGLDPAEQARSSLYPTELIVWGQHKG